MHLRNRASEQLCPTKPGRYSVHGEATLLMLRLHSYYVNLYGARTRVAEYYGAVVCRSKR